MDLRPLTQNFCVSPQIDPADLGALAAAGFTTIINNRPDHEIESDLGSAAMARAAAAAGLSLHYLPVVPGQLDDRLLDDFTAAVDGAPGKVLAYCRSGTRSANVWALSQSGRMAASEIIAAGAAAGYDLSGLTSRSR